MTRIKNDLYIFTRLPLYQMNSLTCGFLRSSVPKRLRNKHTFHEGPIFYQTHERLIVSNSHQLQIMLSLLQERHHAASQLNNANLVDDF